MSEDEEDYARDYAQFSSNAGLNVAEWREMEDEDQKRWDDSQREFMEYLRSRPNVTGVVADGKITRLPKRAPGPRAGNTSGSSLVATVTGPEKKRCDKCGFVVLWEGHEARCRLPTAWDSVHSDKIRSMAWLGDAAHTLDVRRFLVVTGVPAADLEVRAQEFRGRAARAQYYRDHPGIESPADGDTRPESALAILFNASYCGEYRKRYLRRQLSIEREGVEFPGYLEPHLRGFPFSQPL